MHIFHFWTIQILLCDSVCLYATWVNCMGFLKKNIFHNIKHTCGSAVHLDGHENPGTVSDEDWISFEVLYGNWGSWKKGCRIKNWCTVFQCTEHSEDYRKTTLKLGWSKQWLVEGCLWARLASASVISWVLPSFLQCWNKFYLYPQQSVVAFIKITWTFHSYLFHHEDQLDYGENVIYLGCYQKRGTKQSHSGCFCYCHFQIVGKLPVDALINFLH